MNATGDPFDLQLDQLPGLADCDPGCGECRAGEHDFCDDGSQRWGEPEIRCECAWRGHRLPAASLAEALTEALRTAVWAAEQLEEGTSLADLIVDDFYFADRLREQSLKGADVTYERPENGHGQRDPEGYFGGKREVGK